MLCYDINGHGVFFFQSTVVVINRANKQTVPNQSAFLLSAEGSRACNPPPWTGGLNAQLYSKKNMEAFNYERN
jgi:hypothetical protein